MSKKRDTSIIITKEDVLKEFRRLHELNHQQPFNRYFFRKNTKITEADMQDVFASFKDAKEYFIESEGLEFDADKRLLTLQNENRALKQDKQKLLEKNIDEELILDLYKSKQINIPTPTKFNFEKTNNKHKNNREAILVLSDFHCGETIYPDQINGINEYSVDIMKKRVDRIIHYAIYYCKKNDMNILNILFLGDLLSGSIHPELLRTNEYNDVDCLFILHEYLSQKLLELEPHFSKIKCEFLVGNHSRISDGNSGTKLQWKTSPILNWEYILARQLEIQFDLMQKTNKIKKISIGVNNCLFKVIDVANRKFLISHGHTMSNGSNSFAGIGYYGLAQSSAKLLGAMISTKNDELLFQDIIIGHLHNSARVKTTNGNLYINGAVIGAGEFGLYKMRSISEPEQTLLFVVDGKVNNEIILRGNED